ncbi:MFS transporter, partial [Catellatospora sp. NPDC049133]|uniref:MFS transporter n=1 Tax=Catellatospora sp. NPDC049133 TaxID=3155499 RepID=UPI0033CC28B3
LGLLYLVMNASRMLSCALGGLLAERAFGALFVANAAINIVFGIVVYRAVPETNARRPRLAPQITMRATLHDKKLAGFCLVSLTFYTVHTQSVVTLPSLLADAGASPLGYGLLLALDPAVVVVVQVLAQQRITNTAPLVMCAVGALTVGGGLALTGLAPNLGWMAATIPIWVAGEVCFLTASPAVVAAIAPEHLRGLYFGVWGATQGLAAIAAPLLAAGAAAAGAPGLLWVGGAVAGLLTAVVCLGMQAHSPAP